MSAPKPTQREATLRIEVASLYVLLTEIVDAGGKHDRDGSCYDPCRRCRAVREADALLKKRRAVRR